MFINRLVAPGRKSPPPCIPVAIGGDLSAIGKRSAHRGCGYQSKDRLCDPSCKGAGRDITFPGGRKLFMGTSGTGAPLDGADPREPKRP